jgi:hypothetical protein
MLDAREIRLRGKGEEIRLRSVGLVEQLDQPITIEPQVGRDERRVIDVRTFRARELANPIRRVVVVEREEKPSARREGIAFADVLQCAGGIERENGRISIAGVEKLEHMTPRSLDERRRRD